MITRTHEIISLRDTDESHVQVHVAIETVIICLSLTAEVVASMTLS